MPYAEMEEGRQLRRRGGGGVSWRRGFEGGDGAGENRNMVQNRTLSRAFGSFFKGHGVNH